MKLYCKTLALAATVALTGTAQAAISTDSVARGTAGIDGEMFLSVFDPVMQLSYARDLPITVKQFRAQGNTAGTVLSFAADSSLTAFLAQAGSHLSSVRYAVVGADGDGNVDPTFADLTTLGKFGFVTTLSAGSLPTGSATGASGPDRIPNFTANIATYTVGVAAFDASPASNPQVDFAGDYSTPAPFVGPGNDGYHGNATTFGGTLGTSFSINTDATIGTDVAVWALFNDPSTANYDQIPQQFAGVFNLNAATGDLTYSVSAVPLPPAVWLLGSGLMGLLGLRRRS